MMTKGLRQSTNVEDRTGNTLSDSIQNILTTARMALPYSNELPGAQSRAEMVGTKLFGYNMAAELDKVSDTSNHKLK